MWLAAFLRIAAGRFSAEQVGPLWWLSTNPEITSFGTGALAGAKPTIFTFITAFCTAAALMLWLTDLVAHSLACTLLSLAVSTALTAGNPLEQSGLRVL